MTDTKHRAASLQQQSYLLYNGNKSVTKSKAAEGGNDSVYLTCSKKLANSQLSLPHGTNKNVKEK